MDFYKNKSDVCTLVWTDRENMFETEIKICHADNKNGYELLSSFGSILKREGRRIVWNLKLNQQKNEVLFWNGLLAMEGYLMVIL